MTSRAGISFQRRRDEVAQHFRHVHKVCPYSGAAVIKDEIAYADLPEDAVREPAEYPELLQEALAEFKADTRRKMLFLLMDRDFETHDEAHLAIKRLFVELYTAGQVVGGTKRSQDPKYPGRVRDFFEMELQSPRQKIDPPVLSWAFDENQEATFEGSAFTMAVNNLYHPAHPRFSPHPALTLTRSTILDEINRRDPKIAADIRGRSSLALLSTMYPHIPYDQLGSYRLIAPRKFEGIGVDYTFHPDIDKMKAYLAIAQYDKSMYIYPPHDIPRR